MKKSHREEYKQQLQQVNSDCIPLGSPSDVLTQPREVYRITCGCSMMWEPCKKAEKSMNISWMRLVFSWVSKVNENVSSPIFSGEHAIHVLCV